MAHWNEIDNISEKLLKKILLGENKADSIPSQEDHGRLTDKYKNWNALADQSKKVLKYDANKAFQKLQFQKYRRRKIITGWSIAASIVLLLSISIFFIQEAPEGNTRFENRTGLQESHSNFIRWNKLGHPGSSTGYPDKKQRTQDRFVRIKRTQQHDCSSTRRNTIPHAERSQRG